MDIPLPGGSVDQSEDYSPAATVVRFDPPLPLLRAPVPSSAASSEPPVLAFRDAASWRAAWEAAESSLLSQCERRHSTSWCTGWVFSYRITQMQATLVERFIWRSTN
ncbi:hypothetical protein E2562_004921 [Oryza meyeriana var. granulata]|uniref:Uncharacterized protein n=1 Tax=Oryza meyeriana var. granulata TaxID=110450 RepID=A0A6G1C4G7_9ORYZ|nr:hypothetical protein E2562_004921 [Oryza meyeriana var. granulata]